MPKSSVDAVIIEQPVLDTVTDNFGVVIDFGGQGGEHTISGTPHGDWLVGGFQNDTLLGGEGNDTLIGEGGDDVIFGEDGDDTLYGVDGVDVLDGGKGNDFISGGSGRDILLGGAGNDTLRGDSGDDMLVGAEGTDMMYGGKGADVFVFHSVADSSTDSPDQIMDFEDGFDTINFMPIDANETMEGDQDFVEAHGEFTGAGQYLIQLDPDGYTRISLNTDNDLSTIESTIYVHGQITADDIWG